MNTDIHALDKDIPAGKVLLAEYDQITDSDPRPVRTLLGSKINRFGKELRLESVTAGWAIAGSCMRWDNGHYSVNFDDNGTFHGSRFKDLDSALARFNRA